MHHQQHRRKADPRTQTLGRTEADGMRKASGKRNLRQKASGERNPRHKEGQMAHVSQIRSCWHERRVCFADFARIEGSVGDEGIDADESRASLGALR